MDWVVDGWQRDQEKEAIFGSPKECREEMPFGIWRFRMPEGLEAAWPAG